MAANQNEELESCRKRLTEVQLDLLAERDLRIGNLAKVSRAEWELEQLTNKNRELKNQVRELADQIGILNEQLASLRRTFDSQSYRLGRNLVLPYRRFLGKK